MPAAAAAPPPTTTASPFLFVVLLLPLHYVRENERNTAKALPLA